ncbi:ATP-grasp domain-containing protein [Sediminitomix flava]|uniref:ATP-grasp domain-containing protein n=1 Tax=Sediminitomix flava TaxID=379075 RepID=A0A315ZBQ1_SEDFL|nr:hypothetical protein [Sediminitomix flava]PWJ42971.1 hypothetical protein BC781_102518 [Sediminitomix flava]
MRSFIIKIKAWEYWPWQVVYAPIFIYGTWLAIKARSAFFFSATNPGIQNGGLLGESKSAILKLIPQDFIPKTLLFPSEIQLHTITESLEKENLFYPLIAKPDVGERGRWVEKIENEKELSDYLQQIQIPFLIQEYIDYPLEVGIFYYRFPSATKGSVSSIVVKELLSVQGDGKSTLQELILDSPRAFLQWETLKYKYAEELNLVLERGEQKVLESIGNHCRGTKFINGNDFITTELENSIDHIAQQIDGFYYGRFDLRCTSWEDLYAGKNIKIMELNGAKAEPAHIYHPNFPINKAYKTLFKHWNILGKISAENHKNGVEYMSFKEGWEELRRYREILSLDQE